MTDAAGEAHFDSQIERHSLLFWVFEPAVTLINYGVHASFGSNGGVSITQPGYHSATESSFQCEKRECNSHPLYVELHY